MTKDGGGGPEYIHRGTALFRRVNLALFAAGFATFALIYCVQPLLPTFAADFHLDAVNSSLALSCTTLTLAFSMLVASAVSDCFGRKRLMIFSIIASAVLTMVAAQMPGWRGLLACRAVMGITVSGLPAVAMAYLAEEVAPASIGLAMGLYVGGSALGGMAGRLLTGALTDLFGWRRAMLLIGAAGLVAGLLFWRSLPESRHFQPRRVRPAALLRGLAAQVTDTALLGLFAEGFVLMGSFVTLYNYIGFRLLAPPYSLSQTEVGLIFTVYLIGSASSAWMGDLAGRLGPGRVLWACFAAMLAGVAVTLFHGLAVIVFGIALATAGFFAGHSIASSWVGLRARDSKAQAAALYLFSYYLGSSLIGSLGGVFWGWGGWTGVVLLDAVLLAAGLTMARWLGGRKDIASST